MSQPRAVKTATISWPGTRSGVGCGSSPSTELDVSGKDCSVAPGDDFLKYANGTWFATTVIPSDRRSYGDFSVAAERAEKRLAEIVQGAARANAPAGSDERKIGDYYATLMDSAAIDAAGLKPLEPRRATIAAIGGHTEATGGLAEGALVVPHPSDRLKEGARARPAPPE
jgi:putative endopeptidase